MSGSSGGSPSPKFRRAKGWGAFLHCSLKESVPNQPVLAFLICRSFQFEHGSSKLGDDAIVHSAASWQVLSGQLMHVKISFKNVFS